MATRDPHKKLWSSILSNGVRQDADGNWTLINSSTNKRRMEDKGSSVGGDSGSQQKPWYPAKVLVTPEDIKEIWEEQSGKCYWFGIDLDINLLYKNHPEWYPKHPLCPSIDKKDPEGDYSRDNIVISSRFANFGRNVYPFDKFGDIVQKLKNN